MTSRLRFLLAALAATLVMPTGVHAQAAPEQPYEYNVVGDVQRPGAFKTSSPQEKLDKLLQLGKLYTADAYQLRLIRAGNVHWEETVGKANPVPARQLNAGDVLIVSSVTRKGSDFIANSSDSEEFAIVTPGSGVQFRAIEGTVNAEPIIRAYAEAGLKLQTIVPAFGTPTSNAADRNLQDGDVLVFANSHQHSTAMHRDPSPVNMSQQINTQSNAVRGNSTQTTTMPQVRHMPVLETPTPATQPTLELPNVVMPVVVTPADNSGQAQRPVVQVSPPRLPILNARVTDQTKRRHQPDHRLPVQSASMSIVRGTPDNPTLDASHPGNIVSTSASGDLAPVNNAAHQNVHEHGDSLFQSHAGNDSLSDQSAGTGPRPSDTNKWPATAVAAARGCIGRNF